MPQNFNNQRQENIKLSFDKSCGMIDNWKALELKVESIGGNQVIWAKLLVTTNNGLVLVPR